MGHPHSLTNDFWVYVSWVLGKGSGTLSFWAKCGLSFHVLEFLSCWVFAILLKKKPGLMTDPADLMMQFHVFSKKKPVW